MEGKEFSEAVIQKALERTFGPSGKRMTPCPYCGNHLVKRVKFQKHLLQAHGIDFPLVAEAETPQDHDRIVEARNKKGFKSHVTFAKPKGYKSNTTKFTKAKRSGKYSDALSKPPLSGQFESNRRKH